MKRMFSGFFALIILVGMLSACGPASSGSNSNSSDSNQNGSANSGVDQDQTSDPVLYTDQEGFVTILLEDGEVGINFNLPQWEQAWDSMSEFIDLAGMELLQQATFMVKGLPSKAKDIFVGQIPGMNTHSLIPFNLPSIVMLLEDGSVACVAADPLIPVFQAEFEGVSLTGLVGIESLSYESSGEGIGDSTVYAIDEAGLRHDVLIPWRLRYLTEGRWICNLSVDDVGNPEICGYLEFSPDNSVEWYVGWPDSDIAMAYEGTYELILAEDQNLRPGTIAFDMEMTFIIEGEITDKPLVGTYFTEVIDDGEIYLNLYLSDGDSLYDSDINVYEFFLVGASFG